MHSILPLAYTISQFSSAARIGRTSIYRLIHSGALRAVKRGRRTLILDDDARRFMADLPAMRGGQKLES
jgi:excisionase family DNA binding protein